MIRKSMSILFTLVLFVSFVFVVNSQQIEPIEKPVTLSWTAGGVGGGWYMQAGGISTVITEKEPKINIKVVPGGGIVNPVQVSKGLHDLGWGIAFSDYMAFRGLPPLYEESYENYRALGAPFGSFIVHFVAAKEMGLTTVEEMVNMVKDGKAINVATSIPGSTDIPMIEAALEFYGITLKDIEDNGGKIFHVSYTDTVPLFQDRHIDFMFTNLSIPGAAIMEMALSRDLVILSCSKECIDFASEKIGTLHSDTGFCVIPAGTYEGQEEDVPTIATTNELIINKDIPNNIAYTIIKIICENIEEIYSLDKTNKYFIPEKGWENVMVPLHPGAEMYYKEAGYMK